MLLQNKEKTSVKMFRFFENNISNECITCRIYHIINREVHHIAILAYRFHNDKIYAEDLIYP